jgi:outer membrane protein OmpA-like peptidoglycan-associated protein
LWNILQPDPARSRSHLRALDVSAKLHHHLGDEAALYAKAGIMRWSIPGAQPVGAEAEYRHRGWSAVLGTGMAFHFADRLSARLEYQWAPQLTLSSSTEFDLHLLSVGLSYRFGNSQQQPHSATPVPAGVVTTNSNAATLPGLPATPATVPEQAETTTSAEPVIVATMLFATNADSAITAPEPILATVLRRLQQQPRVRLRIVGHADATGAGAYNLQLSARRAKGIADILIHAGIAVERLDISWAGDTQPIAGNNTVTGRQLNRRVELYLVDQR